VLTPFRPDQHGAVVLLFTATLLLLIVATATATLLFLLTGRQVAAWQIDRQVAFQAAEAALLDAETELLAAARQGPASSRFDAWPGRCGEGAQGGLCHTTPGEAPVWTAWLSGNQPPQATGIPMGHFTGASPPGPSAGALPPRYVAELLDDGPAGALLHGSASTGPPRLRITAIGFGRTASTRAVLQTVIQP